MIMEGMPVFVKIEKYKSVLDLLGAAKQKLQDAQSLLHQIEELKNQEDAEIERWKVALESVSMKIGFVDQALTTTKSDEQ